MYEYNYVQIDLNVGGNLKDNHKEIINQYALEGWKLIQIIPISYNVDGKPFKFEAIFEKNKL
jgi:Domain of unknown function (DUF4177)